MINSFFGFSCLPFQKVKPGSDILQTQSLTLLQQRITDFCITKGIALICGESGSGKTTTMEHLIGNVLDTNRFQPLYFSQYPVNPKGFYRLLITKLGYQPKFFHEDLISQLPQLLQDFKSRTKMTPFLIFDEAQNMSVAVLEEIRLMTNLNDNAPLMVLVAHGAFKDRLKMACYQPLRYRLSLAATIEPLSKTEIKDYLAFHLKIAGCDRNVFSDDAATSIFNSSKGVPRIINRIAFESLYLAASKNLNEIDQPIVDNAAFNFI